MEMRMVELNSTMISGRLTADPTLKFTKEQVAILNFRIASSRRYYSKKDESWKENVAFIPVVVWRNQAEKLNEKLHKGCPVFIEGTLESNSWTDNDGNKRSIVQINARRVQVLEKANGNGGDGSSEEEVDELPF